MGRWSFIQGQVHIGGDRLARGSDDAEDASAPDRGSESGDIQRQVLEEDQTP